MNAIIIKHFLGLFYVYVFFLHTLMYTIYVPGAFRCEKKALDLLKLALLLPCVCSELNLVPCISNKCYELLYHLSRLVTTFLAFSKQSIYQETVIYFFVVKRVKYLREKLVLHLISHINSLLCMCFSVFIVISIS